MKVEHRILTFAVALGLAACNPAQAPTATPTPPATPKPTATAVDSFGLGNWHDMIYHEAAGQVILVNGGPETGKPASDPLELWGWDGASWTLVSRDPAGPNWRNFAAVTYDSQHKLLILYGGLTAETEYADTWAWDGKLWTRYPVEGPGHREAAGMTYDSQRGRVILFGGARMGRMMNDTWEWDGSQWTLVAEEGPAGRFPAGFAFDAIRGQAVLFGGHVIDGQGFRTFGDTWTWDGTTWMESEAEGPSPRDGARAVYLPTTGHILLFGGAEAGETIRNLNDTWLWISSKWEPVPVQGPPARVHPAMAFDPARDVVVMTGGSNGPNAILQDTWEWDGESWACVALCQ